MNLRVVVTRSAWRDLAWWHRYYRVTFPEGAVNATRRMDSVVGALAQNPFLGRAVEDFDLRLLPISNTPFALIYAVKENRIEIVRVWDMRQKPSRGFQED